MIERRFFTTRLELRDSDPGAPNGSPSGRAAGYNKLSFDLGEFRERLTPEAFRNTLKQSASDAVYLCQNDNPSLIVGRRFNNLSLEEKSDGLYFHCVLPKTQVAQDLRELVRTGIISECSFAFSVPEGCDDWGNEECDPMDFPDFDSSMGSGKVRCNVRTVRAVHPLIDISFVTSPAYGGGATVATARNYFPEGIPVSVRNHTKGENALLSFQRQQRRLMIARAQ